MHTHLPRLQKVIAAALFMFAVSSTVSPGIANAESTGYTGRCFVFQAARLYVFFDGFNFDYVVDDGFSTGADAVQDLCS